MNKLAASLIILLFGFFAPITPAAAESATQEECVEMTKAAAKMLLENREAGIAEIAKKDGKFVWKDTYVFLMDIKGHMLAHPIIPQLTEKGSLFRVSDKNRQNPKYIFVEFVNMAEEKGEGWIDYLWPRIGAKEPSKKHTFIMRVGDTDMIVGAGVYL